MASNARQYQTIVNYQQLNPAVNAKPRLDPDGYQRAQLVRKEKRMIAKLVAVALLSMLLLATLSNSVLSVDRQLSQSQTKLDKLKTENNKITQEINQTTSLNQLENVASNAQMNRSNDKIKNIN